jgi:SAM-dependent methyltransferase
MRSAATFSARTLRDWSERSVASARVVLPIVFALHRPGGVIDVGCLFGAWAAVCRELGSEDVVAVDGDYVDRNELLVPERCFVGRDLGAPLHLERTFDLAICLEVAHYLPESRAAGLVDDLCALAPVVLFSSAIPHQGGYHHVNEQWPEYWASRFAEHRYTPVDCVRDAVWEHPEVAGWYAQNALIFVSDQAHAAFADQPGYGQCPARVHPSVFLPYAGGRYHALRRAAAGWLARLRRQ